jgi:hypothetical protein
MTLRFKMHKKDLKTFFAKNTKKNQIQKNKSKTLNTKPFFAKTRKQNKTQKKIFKKKPNWKI